jgi:hypothetical protein
MLSAGLLYRHILVQVMPPHLVHWMYNALPDGAFGGERETAQPYVVEVVTGSRIQSNRSTIQSTLVYQPRG